jgi:hypothetical protein
VRRASSASVLAARTMRAILRMAMPSRVLLAGTAAAVPLVHDLLDLLPFARRV